MRGELERVMSGAGLSGHRTSIAEAAKDGSFGRMVSAVSVATLALIAFGASPSRAQTAAPAQAAPAELPPVNVTAPENRRRSVTPTPSHRAQRGTPQRTRQAARHPAPAGQVPSVQSSGADSSSTINAGNSGPPLQQVVSAGKTGTKVGDMPVSVQIIPREVTNQQGVTNLRDAVYNASGINFGGQDSLGYFDHFL